MVDDKKPTDTKAEKGKWHGGKGSARKESDQDKYNDGWERIFGKKDNKSNNNS